ncbi:hypothetical protein CROQUDRAFT_659307 [Cronartium quercuum f. sp. fusiforme G11]|uniref:Uncharacterized protein n=1 Tax=Cronartium quercuum f. sp. fusiforme G11 TaxID=708437 RepID=A0A9P6NIV8_9BASI|nr:hypothetical protein CROQUDRAFT_659307 [Cronartium quercuum f. sp. fusiforme G11]
MNPSSSIFELHPQQSTLPYISLYHPALVLVLASTMAPPTFSIDKHCGRLWT